MRKFEEVPPLAQFFLIFSLLALSGCAFGNRTVMLSYPPEDASQALGIPTAEAAPALGDYPIVIASFRDKRTEKEFIGEVLNSYGHRTADVVAGNEVVQWVTEGMKWELEKAGYNVKMTSDLESNTGQLLIDGEVIEVFCTAYLTYESQIRLRGTREVFGSA